jgi:hypothetical protein
MKKVVASASTAVWLLAAGALHAQTAPFPFVDGRGPVDQAMTAVWQAGFEAPQEAKAAAAQSARVAEATRVLLAHRTEAQATLLASLRGLRADDIEGHVSLGTLVGLLGDDAAVLGHLRGLLMTAPPRPPTRGDDVTHPNRLVRQLAVSQIADAARRGSQTARRLLPELVTSPDRIVVATAVRNYYALSPSRRLAQRELRERMPAANRHLLYVD